MSLSSPSQAASAVLLLFLSGPQLSAAQGPGVQPDLEIESAQSFAELLTNHLQEVSRDKHFRVRYSYDPLSAEAPDSSEPSEAERAAHSSQMTWMNDEEFAYNLQNLGRATIVGETTGGGAHPGADVRIDDHFGAFIPAGRAINPITKTNWEGVGVKPDIEVTAEKALATARLMALKKSLPNIEGPAFQAGVRSEIDALERELSGLEVAP